MDLAGVIWIAGGLVLFVFLWRVGTGLLRSMTTPLPPPPPEGELRKLNVRYRCSVCGAEVKMTMAAEADPAPPRHCMEEMDVIIEAD